MPEYIVEEIGETPYLYVEGESGWAPEEISAEMGRCFAAARAYMDTHGIAAAGPPLALYPEHDPERLRFRAGVVVASEALLSTGGRVQGACTPAGRVASFVHVGPYATLRDDYADLMAWMEREGLEIGGPAWEVYVDDPDEVPEERRRTKVHVALR
jgi:effector-binding domain-containing protein